MAEIPQYVSTEKLAARLDCSTQFLRDLTRDGLLRGVRLGRHLAIDAQSVEEYLQARAVGKPPA